MAAFELIPAPGLQTVFGDGDLRAVVAPSRSELAVFVKGKIGPLAGGQAFGRCIGQAPSLALVLVLNEIPWRDRRWGRARLHVELSPVSSSAFGPRRVLMTRAEGLVRV